MNNYKLTISYRGNRFFGSQYQPDKRTVEGELKKAVNKLYKRPVKMVFSGRTDAGVHAEAQVVNFSAAECIPADKISQAFNAVLPLDITVKKADVVSDKFHARHSAKQRHYCYLFSDREVPNECQDFVSHLPVNVNEEKFGYFKEILLGTHWFGRYCKSERKEKKVERTVCQLDLTKKSRRLLHCEKEWHYYRIDIVADAFLYGMVRVIVALLCELWKDRISIDDLSLLLVKNNQHKVHYTLAPACGLSLLKVTY